MKRKKILTLLLICPFLLTSCSSTNTIKDVYNYDIKVASESSDYYINVSADQIVNLIKAGNEFTLFIWSPGCGVCIDDKPNIEKVLEEDAHSIYAFNVSGYYNDPNYAKLTEYNEDMFPSDDVHSDNYPGTPRMIIIKDKEISTEIREGRLQYAATFKSSINQLAEFSNLYYCSKMAAYNLFIEEFGECEPIIYNTETEDGCKTYREEFIKAQSKSTPTLFVDEAEAEDELKIALGIEVVTSEDEAIEEAEEE